MSGTINFDGSTPSKRKRRLKKQHQAHWKHSSCSKIPISSTVHCGLKRKKTRQACCAVLCIFYIIQERRKKDAGGGLATAPAAANCCCLTRKDKAIGKLISSHSQLLIISLG